MNKPSKEEAEKQIAALTETINHHNHLYYQEDRSEISDFEFDQLLEKLVFLESLYPELKQPDSPTLRVGGTITKNFETAMHAVRMLSLGNTYSKEELVAFDERVAKGLGHRDFEYLCELKFDGVAISMVYENGQLVRAVTRGDGYKGDVVTENVKTIRTVPLIIKNQKSLPPYFEVRGEIFLSRKVFDKINDERISHGENPLANPRNAASGTLKMQDSSIVARRRLDCYLYQLIADELPINKHHEAIAYLANLGFNVSPTFRKCQGLDEVMAYIEEWREKRLQLPVETDGVVIKVNDYQQQEELGFTAKIPKWAIAFKYQAESAEATLLSVTYQVGRTGAITPVANLSPVSLAGTIVKRASLHNANEILRLDLHEGDVVRVEKGGEIIPKITGVVQERRRKGSVPITYIDTCPECGTILERKEGEAKHFCPNEGGCPPQILGRIEHFVSKRAMDIDSLGTERLRALIQQGYVSNPADIYDLPGKKQELLGLEISEEQYSKSSDGYLLISIKKALYALTQQVTLKEIENFLDRNATLNLIEKLVNFAEQEKAKPGRGKANSKRLQKLIALIRNQALDSVPDFIPVAYVLASILPEKEVILTNLIAQSKNKNSLHDLLVKGELEIPDAVQDQINKLKGSTFQEGVVNNMMEGIRVSLSQPFPKVLFALGIRNIGENTAILLAKHFKSITQLMNASDQELLDINGVGETLLQSIRQFFNDKKNRDIIRRLREKGLQFELAESKMSLESRALEGKKILASGRLNHFKRDEIIDFIESHGGTYVKSVSKNLDFIVEGEEMGPSKKEKALKLGISLISEEELLDICKTS
ncbi:NAD-dependent DNA ligase LigA [Cyclobacterium jeungdonense]|uniref:DNA ligase n=1 Tax=Cyclobacterium jeungdonense TaxID=708087 RepID=A0ABT8CER2_9BACT|nr:NAD-dependent DNA ligase LigA [Cyclobacterium jeungdonense]MDN3690273.1 NAD-dependent DNA ligase LigA [Cyclobacterium jeungdonense]